MRYKPTFAVDDPSRNPPAVWRQLSLHEGTTIEHHEIRWRSKRAETRLSCVTRIPEIRQPPPNV